MKQIGVWLSMLGLSVLVACGGSTSTSETEGKNEKVVIPEGTSEEPIAPDEPGEGTPDLTDSTRQLD